MEDLMTDLEKKLTGSTGEVIRRTLYEQISGAEARLQKRIAAGMAPEAFAQAQACVLALKTANDLLSTQVVPANTALHPVMSPLLQSMHSPSLEPALQP
jgi:hypothetical protein